MNFDPRKPHGVIINHPVMRYEQNGMIFDRAGQLVGGTPPIPEEEDTFTPPPKLEPGERDFDLEQAREFLTNILAEGPLRRAEIYKVCTANNQSWEKVKQAFAAMQGEVFNRKNSLYWKLKSD